MFLFTHCVLHNFTALLHELKLTNKNLIKLIQLKEMLDSDLREGTLTI